MIHDRGKEKVCVFHWDWHNLLAFIRLFLRFVFVYFVLLNFKYFLILMCKKKPYFLMF